VQWQQSFEGASMTMIRIGAALLVVVGAMAASARADDATTRPGVTGTVQSIDPGTRAIVLDDGRTYHMREDADVSTISRSPVALACDTDGTNCMVITSGPPDDTIPELQTNPSAGSTGEGESSD
jgi:hypothetical protein